MLLISVLVKQSVIINSKLALSVSLKALVHHSPTDTSICVCTCRLLCTKDIKTRDFWRRLQERIICLLILSRHENLIVQNSPPDNRIGPKTDKVKSFWSFVSNPPTNILCATECLCAFMSYRCVSARQRTHTCARGFRGCAFLIEAYFGHQVSCMSPDVSKLQREIRPSGSVVAMESVFGGTPGTNNDASVCVSDR